MRNDRLERVVLKALNRKHTCAGSFHWHAPDYTTRSTFRLIYKYPERVNNTSVPEVGAIRLETGGWRVYAYDNWAAILGLDKDYILLEKDVPTYSAAARVLTSLCIVRGLT